MKQKQKEFQLTRRSALMAIAGSLTQLPGCGGGADVAGLTSGGTGSFSSGTITGLGSIIVNGIRYNDAGATVVARDDGAPFNTALKLGMVVSVQGSATSAATTAGGTPTATAYRISCGSEWIGQVEAPLGAGTFALFGQTVDVLATTVFEGVAKQLSELSTAHYVEVYGYVDPAGTRLQASRVESSTTQPGQYKLSGAVTALDTLARTFSVGSTNLSYGAGTSVPGSWSVGTLVRVTLETAPAGGRWVASRVRTVESPLEGLEVDDDDEAEIHGIVTAYQSAVSFSVNGIAVDAGKAFVDGTLAVGVAVEVKGRIDNGVVVASKVEVRTESELEAQDFEFHGQVSNLDTVARTFTLKGYNFRYTAGTRFEDVVWATGATPFVEVKASLVDGDWVAIEIEGDR